MGAEAERLHNENGPGGTGIMKAHRYFRHEFPGFDLGMRKSLLHVVDPR
jgi:hypothetical protein